MAGVAAAPVVGLSLAEAKPKAVKGKLKKDWAYELNLSFKPACWQNDAVEFPTVHWFPGALRVEAVHRFAEPQYPERHCEKTFVWMARWETRAYQRRAQATHDWLAQHKDLVIVDLTGNSPMSPEMDNFVNWPRTESDAPIYNRCSIKLVLTDVMCVADLPHDNKVSRREHKRKGG